MILDPARLQKSYAKNSSTLLITLTIRGASRMRAGQGIWILRQGILDLYEAFSGQIACSKTLFLLRAGDVSPLPLDARLQKLLCHKKTNATNKQE